MLSGFMRLTQQLFILGLAHIFVFVADSAASFDARSSFAYSYRYDDECDYEND